MCELRLMDFGMMVKQVARLTQMGQSIVESSSTVIKALVSDTQPFHTFR